MKKRVCAALLCGALMLGLAVPAGAYYLDQETGKLIVPKEIEGFWGTNKGQDLQAQGIYNIHPMAEGYAGEYHEGLYLICESVTLKNPDAGMINNYLDKDLNLVDVNKNRYDLLFPFSGGLAACYRFESTGRGGVGFVNAAGKEVVPIHKDWRAMRIGKVDFAGRFEDGKAVVIRAPISQKTGLHDDLTNSVDTGGNFTNSSGKPWSGIEYAYIDTTGKVITPWKATKDTNELIHLPLYCQAGIWLGHMLDKTTWGTAAKPKDPLAPDAHAPALPAYNQSAPSLFASTAKLTGYHLGDLDYGSGELTITNPAKVTDAGVVAICFVNIDDSNYVGDGDGVFFVPYELAPGESRTYNVDMVGIVNMKMFAGNAIRPTAEELKERVASTIWTFDNNADLLAFYKTIPYEQYWFPRNFANEFQPICDSGWGNIWLQTTADIQRQATSLDGYFYTLPNGRIVEATAANHGEYCERRENGGEN
ncbi:MAG: hypothetical protein RR288_07025 [Oscillibacter sp.]